MKNFLKKFKQLSFWSMVLFISFVINSCDENKDLTKESVNKTGTSLIKADLTELINKIGDRDLKLIELIKNNPISMFKTALYQKTKTSSSEYYFDTDNIMALKNDTNQAVYIIPAYKSSNTRDNNIYSISINITDDFIDTKLNILQLKEDGTQESISYDFVYSSSTSKTSKVKDIECYCTVTISDCPCHPSNHSPSGCDHPVINAANCSCSGSSSSSGFGTTSGSNAGATVISNIWASSGGGTNYGYAYNYTGNIVYVKLTNIIIQSFPDFTFSSLQQLNIKESFEISNLLYGFLKTDGVTLNNKDFVVSIIDAIEEGTVSTYEQCLVLLNAYKTVQIALKIESQIDDTQLDPCLKRIMGQLKNATNADIATVMTKLGAKKDYYVNMVMKPAGTYAEAQKISPYNYEIRVDRDRYTNGTKLFKATSLIHEIIHAYFFSIVDDYNYTPSTALPSFPDLFEAFVKKEHPTSTDKQDAQHLAMANKYVDAMASALQEYDANFTVPYQVYQDLAWGSLRDAPIFEKTFPSGSVENIRITNRYKAESSGHVIDQGTPNQQTPVGKTCI